MSYKHTWLNDIHIFLFKDIPNFFRNLWKFKKALWNHHWYDYSGTLQFLEIGIDDISKNLKERGIEVEHSRLKKVESMNRAVQILTNIRDSNYFNYL